MMKLSPGETFSNEVREAEWTAHNGYCRVEGCTEKIHSFHHRLPNTKANRKEFPLFLHSPFNCAGLCFNHHEGHRSVPNLDITEREAEIYERYL